MKSSVRMHTSFISSRYSILELKINLKYSESCFRCFAPCLKVSSTKNDNYQKFNLWETISEFFYFMEKWCFVPEIFSFLYFIPFYQLQMFWGHDDHRVYFRMYILNHKSFSPETWPDNKCSHKTLGKTLPDLKDCVLNHLITFCNFPIYHNQSKTNYEFIVF